MSALTDLENQLTEAFADWVDCGDSESAELCHDSLAALKAITAERDHYKEIAEQGIQPVIERMCFENGRFDVEITGPMVEAMAVALVGQFKEGGATNFMEMSLYDRDEPFQRYTVTVQKAGALSPADKVRVIENERDEALKEGTDMMWQRRRADEHAEAAEAERDTLRTEVAALKAENERLHNDRRDAWWWVRDPDWSSDEFSFADWFNDKRPLSKMMPLREADHYPPEPSS